MRWFLDNFIRGLVNEKIKSKVFALKEDDCTSEEVLRFVEAEELRHSSVVDLRQERQEGDTA